MGASPWTIFRNFHLLTSRTSNHKQRTSVTREGSSLRHAPRLVSARAGPGSGISPFCEQTSSSDGVHKFISSVFHICHAGETRRFPDVGVGDQPRFWRVSGRGRGDQLTGAFLRTPEQANQVSTNVNNTHTKQPAADIFTAAKCVLGITGNCCACHDLLHVFVVCVEARTWHDIPRGWGNGQVPGLERGMIHAMSSWVPQG